MEKSDSSIAERAEEPRTKGPPVATTAVASPAIVRWEEAKEMPVPFAAEPCDVPPRIVLPEMMQVHEVRIAPLPGTRGRTRSRSCP